MSSIHYLVESGNLASVDTTTWYPVTWMVNGRAFPDLLQSPDVPWFPTQPYNCVPRIHPFETMLIRVVGAGRAQHPMHYHGQDFSVIGINGRMLSSNGGAAGPDLAWKASTFNFTPGQTADMLWEWKGSDLGWDVYGHAPGDPVSDADYEEETQRPDHGQPFPVILAERDDLAFGQFWSGSPFLGPAATCRLPTRASTRWRCLPVPVAFALRERVDHQRYLPGRCADLRGPGSSDDAPLIHQSP